jgi:hypothetical protein
MRLDWLSTREGDPSLVSLPDIYEYGPNGVRDKATATEVVHILTDHGWVRPVEGGAQIGRSFWAWQGCAPKYILALLLTLSGLKA